MFTDATAMKLYNVFGDGLVLLSESQWLETHADCFMKDLASNPSELAALPLKRVVVHETETKTGRILHICCPELAILRQERIGADSWIAFRRIFMRLALHPSLPHYVLHASSVTNGRGQTALVVGVSDAGKTSTMLGLLRQGYTYVCDDYSCLRFSDGKLLALPVGCTVTERTFDLFPELKELRSDNCKFHCQGEWQWTINPGDLYPTVKAYTPLEPTHIFFLYPNHGKESSITPLGHNEALSHLPQH